MFRAVFNVPETPEFHRQDLRISMTYSRVNKDEPDSSKLAISSCGIKCAPFVKIHASCSFPQAPNITNHQPFPSTIKHVSSSSSLRVHHLQVSFLSNPASKSRTNEWNRGLDPIFAVSVGVAAAFVRIRREDKDKGRNMEQTLEVFKRRVAIAWKEYFG